MGKKSATASRTGARDSNVSTDGRSGPWKKNGVDAPSEFGLTWLFRPLHWLVVFMAIAVFALLAPERFAGMYLSLMGHAAAVEKSQAGSQQADDGVGMAENRDLISQLLELLTEVDGLKGDDNHEKRMAASSRVAKQLQNIEKQVDPSTPTGKQHMGLINLVRSALDADREGRDMDTEWNDEAISKEHGLTTYANKDYWEKAYSAGHYSESFEWYGGWSEPDTNKRSLKDLLMPVLPTTSRILMLGAGNSNMSAHMYADGYKQMMNGDISAAVVEQMQARHKDFVGMEYRVLDATALDLESASFDAVLEKGLLDALYAGTGAQVPPMLKELQRVLKPGGQFLSITMQEEGGARLISYSKGGAIRGDGMEEAPVESSSSDSDFQCDRVGRLVFSAKSAAEKDRVGSTTNIFSCRWPTA